MSSSNDQPLNPGLLGQPYRQTNDAVPPQDKPLYEEVRDGWRETFETVSFVVFLVLMLKAFVAEAYVIPTGSMATTLLGDHIHLQCPRCTQKYTVNASNSGQHLEQVQGDGGRKILKLEGCCPNCQYVISNPADSVDGGDKVLVLKPIYDMFKPARHDTVVFKYPQGPQKDFGAYNYIKRLWGLPGEKLAIWGGDVYLVENDKLKIIRKAPDKMLHMRRIVNNNDLLNPQFAQPLTTAWAPVNEQLETPSSPSWESSSNGTVWSSKAQAGDTQWLRYVHRFEPTRAGGFAAGAPHIKGPHLISDFLAYNHLEGRFPLDWVGDLMVETEVEVLESQGQITFQLNKGVYRAEALFKLDSGECIVTLFKDGKEISRHPGSTPLNKTGKHLVRFANFDQRLTLWVGSKLIFGDGIEYSEPQEADMGPRVSDFLPVSVGVQNAKTVLRKLSIWRDIYYSRDRSLQDAMVSADALAVTFEDFKQLARQGNLNTQRRSAWLAYYPSSVQWENRNGTMGQPVFYPEVDKDHPSDRFNADEYFMLGDNSQASQDSRFWGQVPERLLLGQAIWVYWPLRNFSSIR